MRTIITSVLLGLTHLYAISGTVLLVAHELPNRYRAWLRRRLSGSWRLTGRWLLESLCLAALLLLAVRVCGWAAAVPVHSTVMFALLSIRTTLTPPAPPG